MENVWDYPRPPALEPCVKRLRVLLPASDDRQDASPLVIADTKRAYRVLETSHPPTYYIPPEDVNTSLLTPSAARQTTCEWKGRATYWDLNVPDNTQGSTFKGRIWSYEEPNERFKPIKGFFVRQQSSCLLSLHALNWSLRQSFYASPWICMVDEEVVQPQAGDFYGGWKTQDVTGGIKGMKGMQAHNRRRARLIVKTIGGPGTFGW